MRRQQEELQKKVESKGQGGEGEGNKQDGDKEENGKDGENDKKEGGGGKKESKNGEDEKEEGGDGGKKEDKRPATERVEGWAKLHPVYTVLIAAGVVALMIAGYFIWEYIQTYQNTDDAQIDGHTDPISSRISGFVVSTYVENTYRVKKGQVLVDLDPRDYEVALAQARANLSQAQAGVGAQQPNVPITETTQSTQVVTAELSVDGATASLAAAEQSYKAALADLRQTEATAGNAVREEERYRQLVGKQEVTREQYDAQATNARAQESALQSRKAVAEAAGKNVNQAQSTLAQAQKRADEARKNSPRQSAIQAATLRTRVANVKTADAQVQQALLNLTYCRIVAPEDGVIGDKSIQVGSQVAPGQEMLALTQTNDIWVTANFKETQIRNMRPGQAVSIHVDALSQNFDGFVEALPGATGAVYSLLPPENAVGNYVKVVQRLPVRIRFKPGQPHAERLAPGMSVEPQVRVR